MAAVAALPFLAGCSKEKAEALKVAAENFNRDASAAIAAYQAYLGQMIPDFELSAEKFTSDMEGLSEAAPDELTAQEIDGLIVLLKPVETEQTVALDAAFARLSGAYDQFASSLARVTEGNLFSRKPVKDAEAVAAKLTLQLLNLREQSVVVPSIDANKRSDLLNDVKAALAEGDARLKKARLRAIAAEFIALEQRETQAKRELDEKFAKAIVSGDTLLGLVRDYDKLSVMEILAEIQDKTSLVATLTNSATIAELGNEFSAIKTKLESDSYYSILLDRPVLNLSTP
jgi:hypothetical protein